MPNAPRVEPDEVDGVADGVVIGVVDGVMDEPDEFAVDSGINHQHVLATCNIVRLD